MIGNWNNQNVMCAILPRCWALGNGNSDVSGDGSYFPLYIGPAGESLSANNALMTFEDDVGLFDSSEGQLYSTDQTGTTNFCQWLVSYFPTQGIDTNTTLSIELWWEIDANEAVGGFFAQSGFNIGYAVSNGIAIIPLWNTGSSQLRAAAIPYADGPIGGTVLSNEDNGQGLHHWVYVKNGGTQSLYVDGQEVSYLVQLPFSGTITDSNNNILDINSNWNDNFPDGPNLKYHSAIIYDKALSSTEIQTNYNLGPTLGGLVGISNDNNTSLTLKTSSIGNWNNSNCEYGVFPKIYGENGYNSTIVADESFPIYIGPSGNSDMSMIIHDFSVYQNGLISPTDKTGTTDIGNIIISNYDWTTFTETSKKTIEIWVYVNVSIAGPGSTFFLLHDIGTLPNQDVLRFFIKTQPGGNDRLQTVFANNYNTNPLLVKAGAFNEYAGELYHLVLVKDGTTIRLYRNGAEEAYTLDADWTGDWEAVTNITQFLTYYNDNYPVPTHQYEAIVFYDRAMTASEVKENYMLGSNYGGLVATPNNNNTILTLADKSIRTRIREAIFYGVEQITTANGYLVNIGDINEDERSVEELLKYPAVNINFGRELYDVGGHNSGYLEKTLPVTFYVFVKNINEPETEKLRILHDIEKYFMNNDCIPDSNGNDTVRGHINFSDSQTYGMDVNSPAGRISITMNIVYLQSVFNPARILPSVNYPYLDSRPPESVTISKRKALRDALVYNLKKVSTGDGYNYTINSRNISEIEVSPEKINAYPFINIKNVAESVDNSSNYALQDRFLHKVMTIELDCYVQDINGVLDDKEKILSDIEEILMNNYTLPDSNGRRNCTELKLMYNDFKGMETNVPTGVVSIGINVFYVQDKNNPAEIVTG